MRHAADRLTIMRLAVEADIDPRTARRALERGPTAVRGRAGEKAAAAMTRLGLASVTPQEHAAE